MKIRSHRELDVYKMAFRSAMTICELSKNFPAEERYSLTDQIRRSSRSVCANIPRLFGRGNIQKHLLQSYLMLKVKLQKLKHGLISHFNVVI